MQCHCALLMPLLAQQFAGLWNNAATQNAAGRRLVCRIHCRIYAIN
jgi:hypothetical protein